MGEELQLLQAPPGSAVSPVAAFQLAYQGFPWRPTAAYDATSPLAERRRGETEQEEKTCAWERGALEADSIKSEV